MIKYPLVIEPFDREEKENLKRAIDKGQYTMSVEVRKFEQDFASFFSAKYAVMVNSGSSANLIGISALLYSSQHNLKVGDEVLVPAIGWSTTWAPLQQLGLKIKIVDVDLNTLNMDVASILKAITPQTRMILTVSVLGNPLDFETLSKVCKEKNIILFEDNCESIGAHINGKWLGTFGTLGTFSFFYSHHISTIEGGIVLTDNDELYEILLALRAHGWTRELPTSSKLISHDSLLHIKEQYNFLFPGYNLRPLEFSGILGQSQLKKLPHILRQRIHNASVFKQEMSGFKNILLQDNIFGQSSWYAFTLILNDSSETERNRLFEVLKKHGIESRMITGGNLLKQKMKSFFNFSETTSTPNADKAHENGLFVANHALQMEEMFYHLKAALKAFGV